MPLVKITKTLRLLGALCMFSYAVECHGQYEVGQISGFVRDPSGGAVAGASITASSAAIGVTRTTQTNEVGYYVLSNLRVDTYQLSVEAPGFKKFVATGVKVDVNAKLTIDVSLALGQVVETVEVRAKPLQVELSTGEVSKLISGDQITELPLQGRNFRSFLLLLPGMTTGAYGPFLGTGGAFNIHILGTRAGDNTVMLDGVANSYKRGNGQDLNLNNDPNIEAIQEMKVLVSNYSAEYGLFGAGTVNIITKSGTRDFHGSLFQLVRNDKLNARGFFDRVKSRVRFHELDWAVGGPIYIPNKWNTSRDRAFFFVAQKRPRTFSGTDAQNMRTPTAEERSGDFRNSTLPAPIDSLTGKPFPDRVIPPARLSPNGVRLVSMFPLPNQSPPNNLSWSFKTFSKARQDLYKVDYNLKKRWQLSGRFIRDVETSQFVIFTPLLPNIGNSPRNNFGLNVTTAINSTTVNQFSFGATTFVTNNEYQGDSFKRKTYGIDYPKIYPFNLFDLVPTARISGFRELKTHGIGLFYRQTWFQFRDDYSKTVGTHTLKFGGLIYRLRIDQPQDYVFNGFFDFASLSDALLGRFLSYNEAAALDLNYNRKSQFEFYASDNWKVRRNFTLEAGLRVEVIPPHYNLLGQSTFAREFWDPKLAPQVDRKTGALIPGPGDPFNGIVVGGKTWPKAAIGRVTLASDPTTQSLFHNLPRGVTDTYTAVAPRLGFAWDPFGQGKTSIRGGAGFFYGDPGHDTYNAPRNVSISTTIFEGIVDNPTGGRSDTFPRGVVGPERDFKVPTTLNYSFGVQHELPKNIIVDVGYAGHQARHLTRGIQENDLFVGDLLRNPGVNVNALRPYLGMGGISLRRAGAHSNYNALLVHVERRFTEGLSFGAAYTLSKAITDAPENFRNPQDPRNLRAERSLARWDARHQLVFNYIYDLPFFRTQQRVLGKILGGWQIGGITSFRSGMPFNVEVPGDPAGIGRTGQRADLVGQWKLPKSQRTLLRYFNTDAFRRPQSGTFGNSAPSLVIGPGINNWQFALYKNTKVHERVSTQFRAEFYNFFNHPSFTSISSNTGSGTFGAIDSVGPPRNIQLALKIIF